MIDGNVNQEATEVEYPTSTYKRMNESKNAKVIGTFNFYMEGGSFISKRMFKPHLPQPIKFLKMCVHIDPNAKCTKFDSPVHSLLP